MEGYSARPGAKRGWNLRRDVSDDDLQGLVAVAEVSGKVLKPKKKMKSDATAGIFAPIRSMWNRCNKGSLEIIALNQ